MRNPLPSFSDFPRRLVEPADCRAKCIRGRKLGGEIRTIESGEYRFNRWKTRIRAEGGTRFVIFGKLPARELRRSQGSWRNVTHFLETGWVQRLGLFQTWAGSRSCRWKLYIG